MERTQLIANAQPETVVTSGALDRSIDIVVCIPSFRRPQHLQLTLESLAQQRTARSFAIVVVENDALERKSLHVAREFLKTGKLPGVCVVEPLQGNCHAINAAFKTALATFDATMFLMMDDDEIASPDWLGLMVKAAETTGAEVVGGPVVPNFDDDAKRGFSHHPVFRPAYDRSGPVPVIYGSGNCLIRRQVFTKLSDPGFDLRFNFLGGGDTDFFARCRAAGMKSRWVAEAIIFETVPQSRTNLGWIASRGLRIGAINYHVERKAARTVGSRLRLLAKISVLLPLSLVRAGRLLSTKHNALIALHPMIVAAGSMLAAIGIEPEPYKASKINHI